VSIPIVPILQEVSAPLIVPPSWQIGKNTFNTPGLKVESNHIDRIGAMTNPMRIHPESFEHMLQPPQGKVSTTILLDEMSPTEGEEKVQLIGKSNKKEYKSKSKMESEDEKDSPPMTRKIQT